MSSSGAQVASQSFKAGVWYSHGGTIGSTVIANGLLSYLPVRIERPHTFTGIGVQQTVASSIGGIVRMGVYADDGTGLPGAIIQDCGTVPVDGANGAKLLTGLVLPLSGLVWLACRPQFAGATPVTLASYQSGDNLWPAANNNLHFGGAISDSVVNGAVAPLPVVASPSLNGAGFAPLMSLLG